jgi:hypothetical protein
MFTQCTFCHSKFQENGVFGRLPPGRRLAFDPELGRLWVVRKQCRRWNLCAVEQRWEALHELERLVRDRSELVAETDNIALLLAGDLSLIRVGKAGLAERAWWRYGRELHRRRSRFNGARSRLTAYTFGAMAYLSEVVGLADEDLSIGWDDAPAADILRWRWFGWAAWHGSLDCPSCNSSLKALRYDLSWWIFPRIDPDTGQTVVQVPCPRCDPWTPEKVYEIGGPEAQDVLRKVLAYQHITGATQSTIKNAARVIESAGSSEAFETQVTNERRSLWGMGKTHSIALEIALNESAERRIMGLELEAIEFTWKQEEGLARIIDEELTPDDIRQRHLRRLPITVVR